MTNIKFRSNILSTALGMLLGIAIFFTFGYGQMVSANLPGPGDWCPDSGDCTGGYCFKPIAGSSTCKYWGSGSCPTSCHSNPY